MSTPQEEITVWMNALANDSPDAMHRIWNHFYGKLVQYADRKLAGAPRKWIDEHDIASSALHSLYQGAKAGRYPQFANREDLWRILLTITSRKAKKSIRRELAQKRGGGKVRGESIFHRPDGDVGGISDLPGAEPTPEFAELVSHECEELLDALPDATLRRIALLKLQGYTNEEIARELDCAVRSVERKLSRIRGIWLESSG